MHDRGQKGEENTMDRKLKKRLIAFTVPPYDEKQRKETLLLAEQIKEHRPEENMAAQDRGNSAFTGYCHWSGRRTGQLPAPAWLRVYAAPLSDQCP